MSEKGEKKVGVVTKRDLVLGGAALGAANLLDQTFRDSNGIGPWQTNTLERRVSDIFVNEDTARKAFAQDFKKSGVRLWTFKINLLNVGVRHDSKDFQKHINETGLGDALSNADIICREWGPSNGYFRELDRLKKPGAISVNIDRSNNWFSQMLGLGIVPWLIGRIVKDYKEHEGMTRELLLKRILVSLGIASLPISIFNPSYMIANTVEDVSGKFPAWDVSHTADARSVFMALDILQAQENYPGLKILAVTGDVHAEQIHRYLTTAQGELELKGFLYNIVYGVFKHFEAK